MAIDVKQYLPEFYEHDYGRTNTVSHTAEILGQLLEDVETEPFNNWDDRDSLEAELRVKDLIVSGFKLREPAFLKAFYAFKGTNLDLKYILKNIGYDSVIYNDGGYIHRSRDGTERVIPVNELYKDTIPDPRCQVEIKIIVDLNKDDSEFLGYNGINLASIRKICEERLNSCSYLSRVFVEIAAIEQYETMKWTQDYCSILHVIPPFEDPYFEEYKLDQIKYGEEFNGGLKYGREYNSSLIYGANSQPLLRYLSDSASFAKNESITNDTGGSECVLALNGSGLSTVRPSDVLKINKTWGFRESYTDAFQMEDAVEIIRTPKSA